MIYAFILSFEHPRLSEGEALSTLEAEGVEVSSWERVERILLLETLSPGEKLTSASHRSAVIREAIRILGQEEASDPLSIDPEAFQEILTPSQSFAVRASIYNSKLVNRSEKPFLERRLGSLFLEHFPHLKVDLESPDVWVRILYTGHHIIYGYSLCRAGNKGFSQRRPRKRRIFHPATMQPKLARILVNLSGARRGDIVLDPFCGVGGILLEASLSGLQSIGVDLSPWMVEGAKENIEWAGISTLGIIRGDVEHLPLRRVDAIITDPPYGTSSSTGGRRPQSLYKALLEKAAQILPPGRRLVLVHPKNIPLKGYGELGFLEKASYEIRVHKSLTRSIRVLERRASTPYS